MKPIKQMLLLAGVSALMAFSTGDVAAQGRGNFDPAEFRQRMMDRMKEQLEVKDDAEWKIISERIDKVMTAQRDARIGGFGFGGRRGGDRGGDNNGGGERRNRFGGEPNPDVEALQKAVDAKASPEEIKAKLAKVRATVKEKEAALAKAQDELKKVLSVRQEAIAVTMGLLK